MQVLRQEFPQPMTPKQVALFARVSHASAKKWLQRNEGDRVVRAMPGAYRAAADAQLLRNIGIEPFKIHAIQVMLKSPNGGLPPALEGLGSPHRNGARVAEFHGRKVTVQDGGLVSVRASTEPFDVPEFAELAAWLEGLTGGGSAALVGVDLNVDVEDHRLGLRGMKSMTLAGFTNGLFKVYDKQVMNATRIEACLHRVDMGLSEAASVLQQLQTPPEFYRSPGDGWEIT